jgi:ectoine hydroxylase-related dioxygenase (phytanoyl-CoA dioxygenase family)
MNKRWLEHVLTEDEKLEFEDRGYLMIKNALSDTKRRQLTKAVDRIEGEERKKLKLDRHKRVHTLDFMGRDPAFIDLIDHSNTFPKVWGILGWNIQIYLAHMDVTPPEPEDSERGLGLSWHQDTGRVNQEMETSPRPRLSVKVAYFLSDTSETGRGNFHVIPGSQLKDEIKFPKGNRNQMLKGSVPILAPKGSAVIFDRRLWHSASANYWTQDRKVIFFGYAYRWLQARGDCHVEKVWNKLSPIRKQMCRYSPSGIHGYTSPKEEDVPLKSWIKKYQGEEAVRA